MTDENLKILVYCYFIVGLCFIRHQPYLYLAVTLVMYTDFPLDLTYFFWRDGNPRKSITIDNASGPTCSLCSGYPCCVHDNFFAEILQA